MEYLQKFKNYLFSLTPAPSRVTVKNYSLDVKHFISWFEEKYNLPFDPQKITTEDIALFRSDKNNQLSLRSLDRHVSSLRKFFKYLKLQGIIGVSPLDEALNTKQNTDPFKLKEFKDFLYVYNASNLTIKNYIIDLKQFFVWAEEKLQQEAQEGEKELSLFSFLTNDLLTQYRDELVEKQVFSASSINRKLSSLRKYIAWANSQNLLNNQSGLPVNPNEIVNVVSAGQFSLPNPVIAAQDIIKTNAFAKPSEPETTEKKAAYSPFPPFRLIQKISKGINLVLDAVFIAPVAHLALKGHRILWHIQGKPLFVAKGRQAFAFAPVKNIAKAFMHPESVSLHDLAWYQKIIHHARYTRPNWYKRYHSYSISHYFHWAILVIVMSAIGFGFYNNFAQQPNNGKPLLAAAQPNRILSFQGRLTDSSNNAITTSTDLRFGIYTDATSTGSALLWQEVDNIIPDSNGVFSVLLGKGSPIQQALFANNANLYLGITVGQTSELTPRQQLATVAYATNAETLQGLPPITQSGAGTSNVVLALNSSGNLSIGAASTFQTVGGAFTLTGDTLVLNTNTGTNGNIALAPDGQGFIDLQKPLVNTTDNNNISSATGSVEVDDTLAVLATSAAVPAVTINQDGVGTIFTASSGGVSKFTLSNSGTITASNYNTAGGIFFADANGLFIQTSAGSTGQCLTSAGGGTPTWGACGSGGSGTNFWTLLNGTLYPVNTTLDVLFGGDSSSSAKFAFINNAGGTPTASISGNLTLNSAGVIQTTNNQGLTIGGASTGNITLSPLNGNGTVTVGGLGTGVVHATSGVLSTTFVNLTSEVTGILPIANGGTNTSSIGSAGSVAYSTGTAYAFSAVGTSGDCLVSGGASSPTWSNCATAAGVTNYWTLANGSLYPINATLDVFFGGNSSSSAKFAFINNAAGTPTASVSGNLTLNSAGVIQTTNNQPLTIGGNTTGSVSFASNIASDLIPTVTDTYNLGSTGLEWNNLYVKNIITSGNTAGFWQRNLGVISPANITDDISIGGAATGSARFQIFSNGNATTTGTLTFNTSGQLIQTTDNRGLTIGGTTTGNITLSPLNGTGTVTIDGLGTGVVHATGGVLSASNVVLTSEVSGILPIANGGTNTNSLGSAGTVAYSNGTNYAFTSVGSSGQCLVSGGSGNPSWLNCASAANNNYWTLDNGLGILYPVNTTLDVFFGGNSSSSAKFAFINNAGGTPTASISGNLTLNSAGVIQTTNSRPLTIGGTTTGSIHLSPNGTNGLSIDVAGNVGVGTTTSSDFGLEAATNVGPSATDTYDLGSATLEWNNLYVKNIISSGTFGGFWQRNLGLIAPTFISDDVAVGGTSTTSAKFQIFSSTGNATTAGTLTFNGTGNLIQTTNNQGLTIGGDTTGNITLSPLNGNGTVTINGTSLLSSGTSFNLLTNATSLSIGANTGTTTVNNALTATGTFTANSTANLNGDVNLGNATADTITATGRFGSSLIPTTTSTYDLGSGILRWNNVYATNISLPVAGGVDGYWSLANSILYPTNTWNDLAIGGAATTSAKFQVFSNTGNATTAGNLTFNGNGVIQATNNQPLTFGGDSTGNIILQPNNGTGSVTVNGFFNSSLIPLVADTYDLGSISNEWNNLYVKNIVTGGTYAGFWQRNLNALSPTNITDDLLAGGTATTTAKFAVLNMTGNGTPTASVSSGLSGNGMYIAADGTIQTVRNAGLTIGGATTGNITLSPLSGGAGSTVAVNAANITTNQTSINVLNTTATTVNFAGAATTVNLGAGSGTTINLNAATIDSNQATVALFGTPTSITLGNAATTVNIGAATGTTTVKNDLTVNGNVILGTDNTKTIAANGEFSTSLIPNATNTYDLGSSSLAWRNLYLSSSANYGGFWQQFNGALSPTNITNDLLIGATSTTSAKFAVLNVANGTPVASVSSGLSGTAIYLSADGSLQTVRNAALTLGGTTTGGVNFASNVVSNLLPKYTNTYDLGSLALQWNNLYANQIFANGQPITPTWQRNLGVLSPVNITDDVAIGGTATSTAKFQIFANTGNATTTGTFTFAGTNATNLIAARNNAGLTIGDNQTGNIIFNGGNVGVGTTNPTEKFTVNGNVLASIYKDLENPSYYLDAANGTTSLLVAGNVGVGTLTPQNKLDVNGAVAVGSYAGTNTAPLNGLIVSGFGGFGTTNVGNGALVVNQTNLSGTGDVLAASVSGTTKFVVTNDGTVGIADNVNDGSILYKSGLDVRKDSFGNALVLFKQLATDTNADIIVASNSAGTNEFRLTNAGVVQARQFQDLDSTSYFLDPAASGNALIIAGTEGIGTTSPLASSGLDIEKNALGNAAAVVNQYGSGDIFTASASGVTKFTIQNDGTLIAKKYTTLNGILYIGDNSSTIAETAQGASHTLLHGNGTSAPTFAAVDLASEVGSSILPLANGGTNNNLTANNGGIVYSDASKLQILAGTVTAGQCLVSGSSSAPSWGSCGSGTVGWWTESNGALYPINNTLDILVGGSSTESALFSILHVDPGTGTPVASVSSGVSGQATYITADGSIQTARANTLTLGGDTTGNLVLKPQNGTGTVTLFASNLRSQASSFTAFDTTTSLTLGAAAGTTTFASDVDSSKATLALFATPTTVNFGGASQATNFKGNVTLGTDATNTITTNALLNTDLIPTGNGSINLGSPTHYYNTVYANTFIAPVTGGVSGFWQLTNSVISPVNAWNDLAVGGNATGSATPWQVFATTVGSFNTAGTATTAGNLTFRGDPTQSVTRKINLLNGASLGFYPSVGGDSATSVFTIANDGTLTATGTFNLNSGVLATNQTTASLFDATATNINIGSGATGGIGIGNSSGTNTIRGNAVLGSTSGNTIGFIGRASSSLLPNITNNYDLGSNTLTWRNLYLGSALTAANVYLPATGGVGGYWTLGSSVLYPTNNWNDLAIGGTSTASAKFQVFANTTNGDPAGTASTSGYLTFSGNSAPKIQTTDMLPLLIGGSTTGPIQLSPKGTTGLFVSGTGLVGVGTNVPGFSLAVTGNDSSANNNLGTIALSNTAAGGGNWYIRAGATGTNTPAGGLSFANDGDYYLNLTNMGKAGFGTSVIGNGQLVVNQTNNSGLGDVFSASASGTPLFTIANNGTLKNSLIPNITDTYNLGSDPNAGGQEWNNLYVRQIFTSSAGGIAGYWQLNNGAVSPTNITNDVLTGGTATASATFRLTGASANQGTLSVASVSAHTSFAGLVVDNTVGDLFTASSSGLPRFVINQSGNVGIGSGATNPVVPLQISSLAGTDDLLINQPGATNRIANPSFEGASTTSWTLSVSAQLGLNNTATESAMFGSNALRYYNVGPTGTYTATTSCIAVNAGNAYTASAYIYQVSGFGGNTGIDFQTYTDGSCTTGNATAGRVNSSATNQWTRVTSTLSAAAMSGINSVKIRFISDGNNTGRAYADAFQLEQNTTASPYLDGSLGPGYTWDGTPNNSWSRRRAGASFAYHTLNAAGGIGASSKGTTPTLQLDQDGSGAIFTASVSGISKFVIANAGNVGVLTTTLDPNYDSLVVGQRPAADSYASLRLSPQNNINRGWKLEANDNGSSTNNFDLYDVVASKTRLFVNGSSGSVDINGSTPSAALLSVIGSSNNSGNDTFQVWDNTQSGYGFQQYVSYGAATPYLNIGSWSLSKNGYQNLVIPGGNVGIGTTAPGATLDVNGIINASSFKDRDDTNYFIDPAASGNAGIFNGAIGIGTTSPSDSLDIAGNATESGNLSFRGTGTTHNVNILNSGNLSFNTSVGGTSVLNSALYIAAGNNTTAGQVGINNNAPSRQLDATGSWGGNLTSTQDATASNHTDTVTGTSLAYFVNFTLSSPGGSFTTTFNITGLPQVDGTFFMVRVRANTNNTQTATASLQANGQSLGNATGSNGATNKYGLYSYIGGQWNLIASNDSNSQNVDLAELFPYGAKRPIPGELLGSNVQNHQVQLDRTSKEYDQKAMGIVTTNPNILFGKETNEAGIQDENTFPIDGKIGIALAGRVPTIVTSLDGPIDQGDSVTTSPIAGVGMKPNKATQTVGKTLDSFDPLDGNTACTSATSYDTIPWPNDNGTNAAHPCFSVPVSSFDQATQQILQSEYHLNSTDSVYIGKVMVLVGNGFVDPDVYLTTTGDIHFTDASASADFTVPHYYTMTDVIGAPLTRMGRFLELAVGNLRAGSIQTQQLFTNSLAIATSNVTIAGVTLHDYVANIVSEVLQDNLQAVNSPIASINQLHTGVISPLGTDDSIALSLKNSRLEVRNGASGSAVATIDNTGNATFSGTLQSQNLAVNADATISGTLHAGKIVADDIVGLKAAVGTLSAQNITNVTNIYFATPSSAPSGGNFATGFGGNSSTNSGVLNPYLGYTNLASYSGFLAYVPNLSADTAMFNQGLVSLGPTSLGDTTITGQLSIGTNLILADSSVNVLGSSFEIQSLRQGGVNFEGGLIAIDTDGNLMVNGNAVFSKNLAANVISPLANDRDLTVKLGENSQGSSLATANLAVQNASGSGVFSIDQLGNVLASGAATIGKLNLQVAQPALAVSNTELIATGSAGTAAVKANHTEITIDNKLVTNRSLIYITPVGGASVTPYLLRQVTNTSFTVGIPTSQYTDTTFNWLIVN